MYTDLNFMAIFLPVNYLSQKLVQKGLLNFFEVNYFYPTTPPTSRWESRDDNVFLNLWTPLAVGSGNTALGAEVNRS